MTTSQLRRLAIIEAQAKREAEAKLSAPPPTPKKARTPWAAGTRRPSPMRARPGDRPT